VQSQRERFWEALELSIYQTRFDHLISALYSYECFLLPTYDEKYLSDINIYESITRQYLLITYVQCVCRTLEKSTPNSLMNLMTWVQSGI